MLFQTFRGLSNITFIKGLQIEGLGVRVLQIPPTLYPQSTLPFVWRLGRSIAAPRADGQNPALPIIRNIP